MAAGPAGLRAGDEVGGDLSEGLVGVEGHAVVDHDTLQQKTARAAAATKIVDLASKLGERVAQTPAGNDGPPSSLDEPPVPSVRSVRPSAMPRG